MNLSKVLNISLKNVVIIVGNYGSGKTETAINLAVSQKRTGIDVSIADIDLVNPYFRTREAKQYLETLGINVILPPDKYMQADLPILSPLVSGLIKKPGQLAIFDAGGDSVGVTVLAALGDTLKNIDFQMIQVVNPFRPFTETIEGGIKIKNEIEKTSKLKITGIAGNANLIEATCLEDIYKGYEFVLKFSKAVGLPLIFITCDVNLIQKLDITKFNCPILPIERQLLPPWK